MEKLDAQVVAEKDKKSHKKKIDFEKAHLSEKNQQMQTLKMKSSVVNGISMITVYGFMNQM